MSIAMLNRIALLEAQVAELLAWRMEMDPAPDRAARVTAEVADAVEPIVAAFARKPGWPKGKPRKQPTPPEAA